MLCNESSYILLQKLIYIQSAVCSMAAGCRMMCAADSADVGNKEHVEASGQQNIRVSVHARSIRCAMGNAFATCLRCLTFMRIPSQYYAHTLRVNMSCSSVRKALAVGSERALVLYVPSLGLANRLRIVASAILAAEDLGAQLHVHWPRSIGCNASATDLFTRVPFRVYTGSISLLHAFVRQEPNDVVCSDGDTFAIATTNGIRLPEMTERVMRARSLVVLTSTGQFARQNVSCLEYFERKRRIYQRFVESARLDLTQARRALGEDRLWIGLHVRRYDAQHDWPVVPPQDDSQLSVTFNDAASLALHLDAAASVLSKHAGARIFVASNDPNAKLQALARFNDRAVTLSHDLHRDSPAGVRAAFLEWLILAECALVLHTFGSSFGEEAAVLRLAPSVRIRQGGHLLGLDVSRGGSCNHPLFQNADDRQQRALRCYHDPRPSHRQVCAAPLMRQRCDSFEHAWGLSDVFC